MFKKTKATWKICGAFQLCKLLGIDVEQFLKNLGRDGYNAGMDMLRTMVITAEKNTRLTLTEQEVAVMLMSEFIENVRDPEHLTILRKWASECTDAGVMHEFIRDAFIEELDERLSCLPQ